MRQIDRQLQNEFNGEIQDVDSQTHMVARGLHQPGRNNDRDRRNDSGRTFQRRNRNVQRGVNCDGGDEVGDEEDNGGYY